MKHIRESAAIVAVLIALACVVLLADWAAAADSKDYVMMSRDTFELVLRALNECRGHRI